MKFDLVDVHDAVLAQQACTLFDSVWANGPQVVPADLVTAIVHVGGFCALATSDDQVVGASLAIRGHYQGRPVLHSHVTASLRPGAGFALKTHQRQWAAHQGIPAITWTFDPLVRRNAHFNLVKLGCTVSEYLVDFYGPLTDILNAGDETDRLMALWETTPQSRPTIPPAQVHVALRHGADGPEVVGLSPGVVNSVELPADIETMRAHGDPTVGRWRAAVREVLATAMADGWTITGFQADGAYLLEAL